MLPKDSWDLYNKYKRRRPTIKKDIKTKKKSEKSKPNNKKPRTRNIVKTAKVIRKRQFWGQVNKNDRLNKNLKKRNPEKRTYKRSSGQSKRKTR